MTAQEIPRWDNAVRNSRWWRRAVHIALSQSLSIPASGVYCRHQNLPPTFLIMWQEQWQCKVLHWVVRGFNGEVCSFEASSIAKLRLFWLTWELGMAVLVGVRLSLLGLSVRRLVESVCFCMNALWWISWTLKGFIKCLKISMILLPKGNLPNKIQLKFPCHSPQINELTLPLLWFEQGLH
jgi:hypothetical protein